MSSILAIDAAWTDTGSSGVALLQQTHGGWTCLGVAPSYDQFISLPDGGAVDWTRHSKGTKPNPSALLHTAEHLLNGNAVDVVAIDMPMATVPITQRRQADHLISLEFGGRGCSTHSPNAQRPGAISDTLRQEFERLGYALATTDTPPGSTPALIEVYPHPALLALSGAKYRVPYKIERARRYWPNLTSGERKCEIVAMWKAIHGVLNSTITNTGLPLPSIADASQLSVSQLKSYENGLDALICGWVGIQYLEGSCRAYGDGTGAIWTR